MSREQIDAMNRLARENAGGTVDPPDAPEDGPAAEGPRELPKIKLPGEGLQVTQFARECAAVFRDSELVFRKEGVPVVVNPATGGIEALDEYGFGTELERIARTGVVKRVRVEGEEDREVFRTKTTPPTAAKMTLRTRDFIWGLNGLDRVNMVRQPIQRADGRVELLKVGFDGEAGVFTMANEVEIDDRYTAAEAGQVLRSFLSEFPFVSELDLAVQVCSMLSFYGAMLLPFNAARLHFLLKANKHGSGKTLLIKIAVIPAMGKAIVLPFPKEEEELKKILDATAIGGKVYLILDDITGHLKSGELNAFLTAAHWGGRIMHSQRQFEAMRQAVVFLSGHEVTPSPDIARRVLECRLYVEEADITKHQVKNPVEDAYLARPEVRSDLCSALWAIIKGWHAAGRPKVFGDKRPTIRPGFEDWSRMFGSITMFAGFEDPCASRPDDQTSDPEYDDMVALLKNCLASFNEKPEASPFDDEEEAAEPPPPVRMKEFTFAQLIERCVELNAFQWAIDGMWRVDKDSKERHWESTKRTQSTMGRLFGEKYGGTLFQIGLQKIRFGMRGKNRHKHYQVAIVE